MAKKEKSTENNKNKKSFFKGFKAELKKVSWPTPKQLANNTVAVIAIVLLTTAIVFALDIVFETANKQGVEKLKQVISSSNETKTDNTTTEGQTTDNSTATETTEGEGTSEETTGETTDAENQDVQEVQIEDQTQNTETTQTENTANQ